MVVEILTFSPLSIHFVDLKLKLKEVEKATLASNNNAFDRQAMESLLTKRFFIAPSFEIYGGVAGIPLELCIIFLK